MTGPRTLKEAQDDFAKAWAEYRAAERDALHSLLLRVRFYRLVDWIQSKVVAVQNFQNECERRRRTLDWALRFRDEARAMPEAPPPDSQIDPIIWKAMRDSYVAQAEDLEEQARAGHSPKLMAGAPTIFAGRVNYCRAARDGDCHWSGCPRICTCQRYPTHVAMDCPLHGDEPTTHCPLDKGCDRCLRALDNCEC